MQQLSDPEQCQIISNPIGVDLSSFPVFKQLFLSNIIDVNLSGFNQPQQPVIFYLTPYFTPNVK